MSRAEIDSLLKDVGAGVLSLTDETESYAIPESFGYDGESLYFQFVYEEGSRKMEFVETTEVATFTVFTENPAESVLARGCLERVPDPDHGDATTAIAENADIPTLNVIPETAPGDLTAVLYQLIPDDLSGRKFESSALVRGDS